MHLNRRLFIAGSAALLATRLTPLRAADGRRLYASARSSRDGKPMAVIFDGSGADVASIELPARAHQVVPHPNGTACVAVARRPGRYAVMFGPGIEPRWIEVAKGRRFLGHGAFSPDGRLFYTTEEDYDGERGVIGVRDAMDGFRQIGELSSHGIGPHEMALLADGRTLAIANGGLLTHPERGEESADLDRMRSSLTYVDARSGDLVEKRELPQPLRLLSLRHFSVASDGSLVIGGQYYGAESERPPLVAFHTRGSGIETAMAPKSVHRQMRNYVGSIAVDGSGRTAVATSPRGNLVTFWDIATRRHLAHARLADGCGAVAGNDGRRFLLSSGVGRIGEIVPGESDLSLIESAGARWQWDNHLSRLG